MRLAYLIPCESREQYMLTSIITLRFSVRSRVNTASIIVIAYCKL